MLALTSQKVTDMTDFCTSRSDRPSYGDEEPGFRSYEYLKGFRRKQLLSPIVYAKAELP